MAKKKTAKKVATKVASADKNPVVATSGGVGVAKDAPTPDKFSSVKSPGVRTGPVDNQKVALASFGYGMKRNAGMMLQEIPQGGSTLYGGSGSSLPAYNTSYASGGGDGAERDIPPYFVMMNEQNGGILYWPVTLREKYEWYRYFQRTDAYVGRALELLSDLPMSKITLHMPRIEGLSKRKTKEILSFYEYMIDRLNLFERLQQILWEFNLIGNVYAFHEWDKKMKMWSRIVLLPPEEVKVFTYPFTDYARVEYAPERLISLIKAVDSCATGENMNEVTQTIIANIPNEIVKMVKDKGCIVMDTDPKTGSFVHHLARRRSPYMDLGVSVLERVLIPMLQKEHYRYTQLGLASRNMTPKNKITANGLAVPELQDLRSQVDLSYLDPDYSIVTNYDFEWDQIGADARLLDLSQEYEQIENQVFAGLGVTRELLTGEGAYSGTKITVEILNTMFLQVRETLQSYVEKQLFQPVAEAHGWYHKGANNIKEYWYPQLGFNRLTIRDNQEVFDSLFQLYQKGSLPVDIIYELFNLNTDEIHDRIYDQMFTVKDPNFNRVIEEMSGEAARQLGERSNVVEKIGKYLKLEVKPPEQEEGGGFGGEEFGGGGFGEEAPAEEAMSDEDIDEVSGSIADELPDDATDEQIEQVVNEIVSTPAEGEPESEAEPAAE